MESSTVPGSQGMSGPRWSPDGKYLAAHNLVQSTLAIYSFVNKTWTDVFKCPELNWPSWSHDSKSIYVEATIPSVSDSLIRDGIELPQD